MRRSLFATMLAFLMLGVVGVSPAAAAPPSNDDFDNATVIPAIPFTDAVDTTEATFYPDDPVACGGGEQTVWYQFTATEDVRLVADTFGSDYDTMIEVYTGTRGSLNFVTCGISRVIFDALAGETYFIMVNSCCGPGGSLVFNLLEAPPPPPNDDFDAATVIPSIPFTDSIDTFAATLAPDDPLFCSSGEQTVWYQFTATEDARLVADTSGSDYPIVLEVYTGTRGNLSFVNCDVTQVFFDVVAGETYFIMVNSCCGGSGGSLVFNLLEAPPPLELTVSIDPVGSVTQFGTATVSGTVTCSRPVGVQIFGSLEQRAGQFIVRAGFSIFVECDGTTTWSATVRHDSRIFKPSKAFVSVDAFAFDYGRDEFVGAHSEATVQLRSLRK